MNPASAVATRRGPEHWSPSANITTIPSPAAVHIGLVIMAATLGVTGCCGGNRCGQNLGDLSISNGGSETWSLPPPGTMHATVVKAADQQLTIHFDSTEHPLPVADYTFRVGPATAVFAAGQKVTASWCSIGSNPNVDVMLTVRDEQGQIALVSSGKGLEALNAPCVPPEIRVVRVESGCCSRGDVCGDVTPIWLSVRGDGEVTVAPGETRPLSIQGATYSVMNLWAVSIEDSHRCTDHLSHVASYMLFRSN